MKAFNIYMTGVGGQGIGLLSEVLLRAADHAGLAVKSVDTHGLAQRGGVVVSQLRIGDGIHSPLISAGGADMVVAMERHEALRAVGGYLEDGGTLVYYDTVWQPLDVRLGDAAEVTGQAIEAACAERTVRLVKVFEPGLPDTRMQNMAILATMAAGTLVPAVAVAHYRAAMDDLMAGKMLEKNLALFDRVFSTAARS
jgi:indolepyruvate ferredoxin oxidoreductase, beta subunit